MRDEPQCPASNDDHLGWKAYWTAQGIPWRTEPTPERLSCRVGSSAEYC